MTTVIDIDDISKRFVIRKEKSLKERLVNFGRSNLHKDDFWALRDVSLQIESGSTVGLIGPNGSGKSTLLKMIGGILQPTSGTVRLRGRLAALLELGAGFHPDLTGRENVYLNASILGLSRQETDRHFDAIVDFSGIEQFIDTQVKFYSSGMYVRLAFAVAVHVDPDILLVDEVLAVGDEPFQRKCLERIRGFQHEGRTIVLVTHGLDQVAEFCDRAVVLEHGRVAADGPPREALRVLRADFEATRQDEIERKQASIEVASRLPRARFTGVALQSDSGETGSPVLQTGEGLTVAVEIQADSALPEGFEIGIGIATPLGTVLGGTNTRLLETPPAALEGTGRYRFHVDSLQLGDGEYIVQTSLTMPDGSEVHGVPEAAHFTVKADGRSQGPLHLDAVFEPATA
ncbi:MAG: ABC transporter ATP-binding protein [Cellulomonas sp.]|uniref:ABC transporter ATP-binding protein n=1 Tax=Cellulomonas sp. TaxID=40001 RepID=UPI0019E5202A|nr:ABC transporter ATP-binding protein [Cellulomonas sp.]MBF0687192.1 ABC transporter ATP-binding protein [Cellulomonas sp.]